MNAHMQINSPVLRRQAMLARERRERLWPQSKLRRPAPRVADVQHDLHVIAWRRLSERVVVMGEDASAHIDPWRIAACASAPPTRRVIEHAAQRFGLTRADILGRVQRPRYVLARQAAIYIVYWTTHVSFPETGRRFGGRDHTTIIHATRSVAARLAVDAKLREDIEFIRSAAALQWREGAPHAGA